MSRFFLFLILSLVSNVILATALTEEKTPEPLKPWIDWVLQDQKQYKCPFFYNNFQQKYCSWPGRLAMELTSKQAHFSSRWQVYKTNWITLPGNKAYWPQNVTVNNKPALVMNKKGKPRIKLTAGLYDVKGVFFWDRIPESIAIPENTGLFSLTVNGKNIPYPMIKKDVVWLKESDRGQKKPKSVENKLELQVFRKVYDHVPLQLITHLELEVSGDQREISLPYALLTDFIPISLNSPLPARIEADGSLLLQVRPGRWHIELKARHPQQITELKLNIEDKQWPAEEIWSFHTLPFQRVVEVINLKSIDPSQTNVPRAWKKLPAYLLKQGETMGFKVIRRGDSEPEPNQLNLKRQLWLDFDGAAYTVADSITGTMSKGWRLNGLPETQIGQVKLNGKSQLVTQSIDSNKQGVELRQGHIRMQADSRIVGDIGHLSATGWEQNFHQLQAELNIPPGWRLLAASGVDNVPNSWISQWTLLDIFVLLIVSLAISRLWTVYWGLFALMSLVLCWHEPGAPQFIWLNILAAIALIKVLPAGKFQQLIKCYRNLCWLGLLLIVIPFMVSQVRTGLYPQLEKQWQKISSTQVSYDEDKEMKLEDAMPQSMAKMRKLASPVPTGSNQLTKQVTKLKPIDPDANIQTGPGLPQWQWTKVRLSWNGAVDSQQQLSLWYLSPTLSMLFKFLSVLLVSVLSLLMFGVVDKNFKFATPLFSWVLLIPLLSLPVQDVYAEFPEQQLLDELKSRLLQAPDCLPVCAQIPTMDIEISQKQLSMTLQVLAQQPVAIPLPAKQGQWMPNQILLNKRPAQALIRNNKGELWLSLDKGQHSIELQGINPAQNKFSLPLLLKPHWTKTKAQGWTIEGVAENGRTEHQLIISRVKTIQQLQASKKNLEPGVLPAFIRIERTLNLGLDWRVNTRVVRVFNNGAALAIKLPLLKGESVTTENIRVKDRQVLINLSPRQNSLQWESVLEKSDQIELQAANTTLWTERWQANVSPVWHLQSSGISVVHHQNQGQWMPEWLPWAGEKVSLMITRPKAVIGPTLTIDKTELQIKPGKRSLETELKLSIRSSKGMQHTITLPEQVQLQVVKINGVNQPIRQKNSQVSLPIKPGKQNITLSWRKMQEQTMHLSTASLNLGIASVNNHLKILLGQDRWVLFTSGPKFGPAVLFWGVLIVIALLAIGLGKILITPLKHWHWFLLLVGLSQIPIESALCVVFWLIVLGFRANKQITHRVAFNFMQVGIGLLSITSLLLLFFAVQQGLLGSPDMQIAGNQSSAFNLNWYQDRSAELLPTATVISVPLMSYRILMLLWSLWLAVSLLDWLKWGWACFSTGGLWKRKQDIDKASILNKADSESPEQ